MKRGLRAPRTSDNGCCVSFAAVPSPTAIALNAPSSVAYHSAMWPDYAWIHAPSIEEPWGFVYLCGACANEPSSLRWDEDGFLCGRHEPGPEDLAIPLEDAAQEAWPRLKRREQFSQIGFAARTLLAIASGSLYLPVGLAWAKELWAAAVRIRSRKDG